MNIPYIMYGGGGGIIYIFHRIQIPIPTQIQTENQMATLYYVELFTLHGVIFIIQF